MDLLGERDDSLILGRVTVHGERLEPVSTRLSLEGALRGADLSLPTLPPGAIVCIRRLDDPLPRRLRADRATLRPPSAWRTALASRVEDLCRRAERPWLGPVTEEAAVVRFESRAELLACLARDVADGAMTGAWWYDEIFDGSTGLAGLLPAMRARPEHVPPMMALLADRGLAAPFGSRLGGPEALGLVEALIARFALVTTQSLARLPPIGGPAHHDARPAEPPIQWAPVAPETEGLRQVGLFLQELFLGLALTLARAPEMARRAPFAVRAAELWAWAASPKAAPAAPDRVDERTGGELRRQSWRPSEEIARDRAADASESRPPFEPLTRDAVGQSDGREPDLDGTPGPADTMFEAWVRVALDDSCGTWNGTRAATRADGGADVVASANVERASVSGRDEPFGRARTLVTRDEPTPVTPSVRSIVQTRLGGLFFLINLGIVLDLYGDFTTPLSPGIDLSIWDFIALVGAELLEGEVPDDPVFGLLAGLAGRPPGEPLGGGFEPPDKWRVPASWLRPFAGEGPWTWSVARKRLKIAHPAGFLVVDVPAESRPVEQVARELDAYTAAAVPADSDAVQAETNASPLRTWLDWLVPYVQARLERAMPLGEYTNRGRLLLEIGASVEIDGSRLDVVMSLAELPIEVRLSGLDRDPGWVPAAGKTVVFRFIV